MRLYSGPSRAFIDDSVHNQVAEKLATAYFDNFRHPASPSEIASWRNSLRAMSQVLDYGRFHDHGVLLEYELPMSSKRLDCLVTGRDGASADRAVIVELKQWEACEEGDGDNVVTFIGRRDRDVLHPAVQVDRYRTYLQDMHSAFHPGPREVGLGSCAYLHNYKLRPEDPVLAAKFQPSLATSPLFSMDDVEGLVAYLRERIGAGQGLPALERILESELKPSKKLLQHVGQLLEGRREYVLLDEQEVAFNRVIAEATAAAKRPGKSAIVIRGGPGTGKSVIALNLLAELSRRGLHTNYVTGSRAFTSTLRKIVGPRASALLKYFNDYRAAVAERVDVMICDEAHRIRRTSNSQWMGKGERTDRPQIEELFNAAKVLVFFIDERQVVRPDEVGSVPLLLEKSQAAKARVFDYKLEAQFRCNGSDAFIQWVNNTLEVERTPQVLWNVADPFEFRILETPADVEKLIQAHVAEGHSARMSAGFCWPWSKEPEKGGALAKDVVVADWKRPWNARPEAKGLAKDIPPANLWAYDARGLGQVGCVYTAQGFEFDYVGVVFGKDLLYRSGKGWVGDPKASFDSVVKRAKDGFLDLVKNTYRVLLTRGLRGCYVCCLDKETENFLRSRTEDVRSGGQQG